MKKVFDRRRLCTEADLFQTRKSGKTELGAAFDFAEFICMGPMNAQVSIVANGREAAIDIAYKPVKAYAMQVDPSASNRLGGNLLKVGAESMEFKQPASHPRTASLQAFPAGGHAKDGWNTEWVHNDEAGQGKYVNDHCDMEGTVQELIGSQGTRRERMRLNTTTAGKVVTGPYKDHIERLETQLLDEMQIPLGTAQPLPYDYNNALLLRLDPWDWTGNVEDLNHRHLFRRVNRAIGITVQPTWYKERIQKALSGTEDERKEVLTKDFNIWQSERIIKWIQPEEIRKLQIKTRIDELSQEDGWLCFIGQDFSKGDDLCGQSYLCVRETEEGTEFFADLDAWISEYALEHSPNGPLYETLIKGGWLHVCPGKTINEMDVLERTKQVAEHVAIMQWGYDSYDAMRFVNAIGLWLQTEHELDQKDLMRPVSQTYASYNSPVQEMQYMVQNEPPLIKFSPNPLWSWEFGNCALEEDKYENQKPVKRTANGKVDNVQALLSALKCYDEYNEAMNNDRD